MDKGILIGREKEIKRITELMQRRKHMIIFGQEGVGKTLIINEVMSNVGADRILYSPQSRTLKEVLVNLVSSGMGFCNCAKNTAQENILALKKLFYKILDKSPQYLIFDQVVKMRPKYYSFLDYLVMERQIPIIILSRGLRKEHIGHLGMIL